MTLESNLELEKIENANNLIESIINYKGNNHYSTFKEKIQKKIKENDKNFGEGELYYAIHEYLVSQSKRQLEKYENKKLKELNPRWFQMIEYGISAGVIENKKIKKFGEIINQKELIKNQPNLLKKEVSLYLI